MGNSNEVKARAVCKNCMHTGEVDSGAPGPQGYYITIACPVCNGIGAMSMDKLRYDSDCCGFRIHIFSNQHFKMALALDDLDRIVDSESCEYVLCRRLMEDYCM